MTIGIGAGLTFGVGQPLQYPYVNGFAPSWASVEFRPQILGGAPLPVIVTVQSVDYEVSNDSKEVRGTNPNPLAVTRGEVLNTGKCKMLLYEFNQFANALGSADITGNNAYGDVFFDVQVQFSEAGGPVITDSLKACRIYKVTQTMSVSADAIVVEIDLRPLQILRNNQPMSSAILSAPQFP
jgi:hypothetical protein